jgi:hypothetical protein
VSCDLMSDLIASPSRPAPVRLLPRRLPWIASTARVIQARQDVVDGERVAERWIRHLGADVRVLLAVRLTIPDAWVQLGPVASPPRWAVELWHQPHGGRRLEDSAPRSPEVLRRGRHLFADRAVAEARAREEADLLGVPYREAR